MSIIRDSNTVTKRMVIKPFKSTPTIPPDFETEAWKKLVSAISAVCNQTTINISKEELYRVIY
jgi:hypothetical protein